MRIAILSGGDGWHVRDLLHTAGELRHVAEVVDFRRVAAATPPTHVGGSPSLDGFDAVIVRTMPPGSLEQVVFRMDLLHALEARGVPILNPPRALEVCVDKYLALVRLQSAGLRVPETIVCQNADAALEAFETLGRDVVVKPIFGSEGRGMVRASDPELAWRTFRAIERTQAVLYVQQFIPHPGWDLRAFVLNGKVLAAVRRVSSGDWRTNVSQGAIAEPATLTREQEELALRAAAAVGTIAAGVDLLPGPSGELYVIEVNAVPGWRALAPATGVDVAKALIDAVSGDPSAPCHTSMLDNSQLAQDLLQACIWEVTARKAGNVHPSERFHNLRYSDFVLSALNACPELAKAPTRPLGETILAAMRATRSVVRTNTNLRILLLLAPLAKVPTGVDLRMGVGDILARTTVQDAVDVYEAIRLASAGALGQVEDQDIRERPTLPLRDVMALAQDRDMIAQQYVNGFAEVFDLGVPALLEGLGIRHGDLEGAILFCQLVLLSKLPDSLIRRKRGDKLAREVSWRAGRVLALWRLGTEHGNPAYWEFDRWLRSETNAQNPGTTADLIAACLFVAFRERKITT